MKAKIVRYSIRPIKKSNKLQKIQMDLDYPSQKKNDLSHQLNQVDRRYGSIVLSNPKMQVPLKPINEKLKKKVINLICKDDHSTLLNMLDRKTVTLKDEISKQGHAWTILHYIAKYNSQKCMDFCLRWQYQGNPREYEQTLNVKNCQQDTPLIVACTHKSNSIVRTILNYGLADIYAMNLKKLNAYQIALNSSNQQALQMLMKYEVKIKKKNFVNKESLSLPLPSSQGKTFQRLYEWFIQCFSFGPNSSSIQNCKTTNTETDRKMARNEESHEQMTNIEIEWAQPQKMYGKKVNLFSNISQPFQIKQSNVIVSNLLIIFQAFAQHPQLLKKIIINVEDKYCVRLGGQNQEKILWVDNLFPYFVQTKEPLFLWLEDQLWPMVLQKALSQFYNGYFQPAKVPVEQILETVSGNEYFIMPLSSDYKKQEREQIKQLFQKIQSKNCILILKAKENCPLKPEEGRIQCFSLLKIMMNKFLINCPFKVPDQHINESKYSIQMKLHMAHYHNQSCTAVWLEEDNFFTYFSEAVFCHTLSIPSLRTSQTKVTSSSNRAYIIIKIKDHSENDKIYLTFTNADGKPIIPVKCVGWAMLGADRENVEKINTQILGIVQLSGVLMPSQVLLMCEFGQFYGQEHNSLRVICRSEQMSSVQPLDCAIGDLQFIECCKKYYRDNYNEYNAPIIQAIGDYVLAMAVSQQTCYIPLPISLSQDNVIEGMFIQSDSRLQMFEFGKIYFAVLSNVDSEILKNLKIMTYQSIAANGGKDQKSSAHHLDSV